MTRVRSWSWLVGLALCATVAGCGDDEDNGSSVPTGGKDAGSDAGRDAGRPQVDAQVPRDAGHDAGPDDDAGSTPCDDTACAASADECHVGACNDATNQCVLTPKSDGSLCGSGDDSLCTDQDRCMAGVCVPNHAASGTPCGDVGVDCRVDDTCDGNGQCVDNGFAAANTACGSNADTACDNPNTCDANGVCQANFELADTVCGDANVECHHPDRCNGSGVCQDGGLWTTTTVGDYSLCGAAGGTSISGAPFCRCGDQSVNECSNFDVCVAGACTPNDVNEGGNCGTVGECETQRKCQSGSCVPTFKNDGAGCGSSTNAAPCNLPDSCQGGVCQANEALNGTACGDSTANRQCDGADSCQGGVCNPNHYGAIVCGSAVDECELPNRCSAGSCLPDPAQYEPVGTSCGDSVTNTACDASDTCNGGGACLDNLTTPGTPCGDTVTDTECDAPDTCNAAGACADNLAAPNAPCGDYLTDTDCDGADGCDGAGLCDTHLADEGTSCGPPATGCTLQDECDGSGLCEDQGTSSSCMGQVTGRVVADASGNPLAGVSVSIPGSGATPAITNANGEFSLQAPLYQAVVVVTSDSSGYWGLSRYDQFTESDLDAGEFRLQADAFVAAFMSVFPGSPTSDPSKAMVSISFSGVSGSGGEGASLSATGQGPFAQDGASWIASDDLVTGTLLALVNVAPGSGTTSVTVHGNGSNTCAVRGDLTSWPLAAHTVASIEVVCE